MNRATWRTVLSVAFGGVVGALSRHAVTLAFGELPGEDVIGTMVANISGAFLLGIFAAFTSGRTDVEPNLQRGVMIGMFGSYTTLSALSYQTVELIDDGQFLWAALYSTGSFLLGLTAVACGVRIGRR